MISVRKASKTTISLIAFIVVFLFLVCWISSLSGITLFKLNRIVDSRKQLGVFHSLIIGITFWCLLIADGLDAVYLEKSGLHLLRSFTSLFVLTFILFVAAATFNYTNIRLFWLCYYIITIISLKISIEKIKKIEDTLLSSNLTKVNEDTAGKLDCKTIWFSKSTLQIVWRVLIGSFVVFCIQLIRSMDM